MDILLNIYLIASVVVIIFQLWYIKRLRKVIQFAVESLQRYATALLNEDRQEIERIDNDVKNFK